MVCIHSFSGLFVNTQIHRRVRRPNILKSMSTVEPIQADSGPETPTSSSNPSTTTHDDPSTQIDEAERARRAAANKKKRDKKKAKKAEESDPAVIALGINFEKFSMHNYFTGNFALRYNKTQGRHVVATVDLPAGTVVLDQEPYAGVVSYPLQSFIHYIRMLLLVVVHLVWFTFLINCILSIYLSSPLGDRCSCPTCLSCLFWCYHYRCCDMS